MSFQSLETTLRMRRLILQARDNNPEKCIADQAVNEAVKNVLENLGTDAFHVSEETLRQRYCQ